MRKRSGFIIGVLFIIIFMFTAQPAFAKTIYRVGFEVSGKSIQFKAMEKMAEYVLEKTNGEYELRLFPGGQLGPAREQFQQMKMGALDFGLHTNNSPTLVTEGQNFNATAAPYVFRSTDEYKKFLKSPLAEEMSGWLEEGGVKVIGYTGYRPPRALTTTNLPVRVPEDMKGLKIRVPGMKILRAFFQECGANPTPMPFTELFTALKTGIVEAQDNGIDIVESNGFYAVQKYYMKLDHALGAQMLYASAAKWKKIPDDVKQIIIEGCEVSGNHNDKEYDEYQKVAYKVLEEKGMTVMDVDKEAFEKIGKQVWEKFDGELWEKGFMDRVQKQVAEYR